jgi:hypothetical protein
VNPASVEAYPSSCEPRLVGSYPVNVFQGGGLVYHRLLEYRLYIHTETERRLMAFDQYEQAVALCHLYGFQRQGLSPRITALIEQLRWIEVDLFGTPRIYQGRRLCEWDPIYLVGNRDTPQRFASLRRTISGDVY